MRLAVINTGGTISCVGNPLAPMTSEEFADACQRILTPIFTDSYPDLDLVYITDMVFPTTGVGTLDSTNLQPSDWCVMAERILQEYDQFDGWVILHGTDSMAYTASALPFLLSSFDAEGNPIAVLNKPVILTGSQAPLFNQDTPEDPLSLRYATDAYQNLCAAIGFAHTGIPEVAVAFRGKLLRGTRVLKTNADLDEAFSSPNLPPLGTYGIHLKMDVTLRLPGPRNRQVSLENPSVLERMNTRLDHISRHIDAASVVLFPAFPAVFSGGNQPQSLIADLLEGALTVGVKGIVLESYGAGNFPSGSTDHQPGAIEQVLSNASTSGIVIANCTQVLSGTVNASIYAAGAWLPKAGAVSMGDMTPIAAFTKLMVLLAEENWEGNNWPQGTVTKLAQKSLLGERAVNDRLETSLRSALFAGESLATLSGDAVLTNDPTSGIRLVGADGSALWDPAVGTGVLRLDQRGVEIVDRNGETVWSLLAQEPVCALTLSSTAHRGVVLALVNPLGASVKVIHQSEK